MVRDLRRQWSARWRTWRSIDDMLKRRVRVEQYLFDAAAGKAPLPDAEQCRTLALSLGVHGEPIKPWASVVKKAEAIITELRETR